MKQKILIFYILLNLQNINCNQEVLSAVTYTFSGGRFGDNLVAYLHAKWISYKHQIPLLYKPFPYSDQLSMHQQEQYLSNSKMQFNNIVEFRRGTDLVIDKYSKTLYVIPYFPESMEEHRVPEPGINTSNCGNRFYFPYFEVNWNDHDFINEIRNFVKPIKFLNLIQLKKEDNSLNIAMHLRKNSGGFDLPLLDGLTEEQYNPYTTYVDTVFPLKHVPDRYYIEQIQKMIPMFPDRKLYIFVFTDDPEPAKVVSKFEKEFESNKNITFDYRKTTNNHFTNLLEDFFSMTQFDCFIRNDSNFSICASKLGKYKVLIQPVHHKWVDRNLYIDEVKVTVNC